MDPLSIIASTIAIAHSVRVVLQKAQHISSAKSDLHALSNEVADLSVVLQAIERSLENQRHTAASQQDILFVQSILPLRAQLQVLARQITDWIGNASTGPGSFEARRVPWLRMGVKAKRFKDEVRTLRSQLVTALGSISA
jgi:hypothetical protein